ncbi:MAG: hypothetical protein IKO74_07155 [Selenomonadaceae bacterium]|nr:hypothetical protein [Selenomonadaceae bacterium]
MLQSQTIDSENLLTTEIDDNEKITFTGLEWKFFVAELKDMIATGEFDIAKAMTGARFYAEMARRTENIKARRNVVEFTAEEWERFVNEQTV